MEKQDRDAVSSVNEFRFRRIRPELSKINPYDVSKAQRDAFLKFARDFHNEIARGKLDRLNRVVKEIAIQRTRIQQAADMAYDRDAEKIEQLYRRSLAFKKHGLDPEKLLKTRIAFRNPRTAGSAASSYTSVYDSGVSSVRGRGRPSKHSSDSVFSTFTSSPDGFLQFRSFDSDDKGEDDSLSQRLLALTQDMDFRDADHSKSSRKQLPSFSSSPQKALPPPTRKLLTAG